MNNFKKSGGKIYSVSTSIGGGSLFSYGGPPLKKKAPHLDKQ